MDAGEAQDELYNAGYEITITYDRLASEPEGTVISQDPAGGAEVMSLSIFYVVAGSNPYPDY
jgi:beta-lactam-binding protein with PASTA domain